MISDLSSYKPLYIKTAYDHVQQMQNSLSLLTQNADDKTAIGEIYRHAHSLNSGSILMGYKNVQALADAMEKTFFAIQDQKTILTVAILSSMRVSLEKLANLLQMIEKANADLTTDETIGMLENAVIKSSGEHHLVYVVDDDIFFQKFYSSKLREMGYAVETASNGEEGIWKMKKNLPDLLLLDLIMPKKDGFDVLKEMAQDEQLKHIPVLVFSTLNQPYDMEQAIKLGAKDHINKSIADFEEAKTKITAVLSK